MVEGAPVLSRGYETSVPGLFVIGPASAQSFGPVARFVYGAAHPARSLARRFAGARASTKEVRGVNHFPFAAENS